GNEELFTKTLEEIPRHSVPEEENDLTLAWTASATLLMNGRQEDALSLLRKRKDVVRQFELLSAQGRFREAFALDRKGLPPDPAKSEWLDLSRARALMRLGERKKASASMEKIYAGLEGTKEQRYDFFLEAEARMGLRDEAIDHCVRTVAKFPENLTSYA